MSIKPKRQINSAYGRNTNISLGLKIPTDKNEKVTWQPGPGCFSNVCGCKNYTVNVAVIMYMDLHPECGR